MSYLFRTLVLGLVAYAAAFAAGTDPACAEIASVGGSVTIQATPTGTVAENTIESANESVWFESDGFLGSNVTVQHDGTAGTFSTFGQLTQGTLYAGTYFQSYLVQFDPVGGPNPAVVLGTSGNVTITFTDEIIGVFAQSTGANGLNASDGTFAPSGATYNFINTRRFENTSDIFVISTDRLTLTINRSQVINNNADQLRILINPEPSTGLLFGLGLVVGAGVLRRRRRRRLKARSGATELTQ